MATTGNVLVVSLERPPRAVFWLTAALYLIGLGGLGLRLYGACCRASVKLV